jgi:uncharacterized protein (DUF2252 family)
VIRAAVRSYREAMRGFATMRGLDVWYLRLDVERLTGQWQSEMTRRRRKTVARHAAKAHAKDSLKAFGKLTRMVDGRPRLRSDPPLLVPIDELLPPDESRRLEDALGGLLRGYRRSLEPHRRQLVDRYRPVDMARKVVGIGSVGTRAWVVLLLGPGDHDDPLFLQVKEASASVLEPFAGALRTKSQGRRIVDGQHLMQSASDILLGYLSADGFDGRPRDFYVRQLWDRKASVEMELMDLSAVRINAEMCGWTLARAHARAGNPAAIAAYAGRGKKLDRALADFAETYADQNERDYAALATAVDNGSVTAGPALR